MSEKGQANSVKHTFQSGNMTVNHKPVGNEVIKSKDGYIKVKIAEPRQWALNHKDIWEQHHGAIPEGFNVQFKDGNRNNCSIDNLYIIHLKKQVVENSFVRYTVELRIAIKRFSKITKLIKTYENHH